MRAAGASLDDFATKGDATAARTEASAGRLSKVFLGLGVAVAAALLGAVAAASSFETQMRNVSSLGGVTESTFKQMSASVLDLSRTLPQSATDLAKGLYDIASSGFQGAEGLEVLEASAKAASAGLATTAEAAKAVTAVLNAYGLESSDAARVSDILFQTVNLGVVSFSELTGVIGDVVGSAAAAGVSIDQVGAAIATMTLSGVTASEAGTSLNRVLQSFIKPSDSMSLALRSIGYESGVAALKQDGLRGVMEKLRVATGGNVEVTVALFDEIRAARGALALMADEGQNYARVVDGMTQATEGAGATQRAFAEQSKALSFQIKTAKNEIMALVIEGATPLLGFLKDGIAGLREMAQAAGPGLGRALQMLQPFFAGLTAVGGDLVTVLSDLYKNVGPLAGALVGLAGGATIGTLNGIATALAGLTSVLRENEEIVAALAILYGAKLVAGLVGSLAYMAVWRSSAIASTLATGGLAAATTALSSALAVAPWAAVALALGAAYVGFQRAKEGAEGLYQSLVKDIDLTSYRGLTQALDDIGQAQMDLESNTKSQGGIFNAFRGAVELVTPMKNSVQDTREAVKLLNIEAERLAQIRINTFDNLNNAANQTGQTRDAVEALAKKLHIDLTQGGEAGEKSVRKVVAAFKDLVKDAFGSSSAVAAAGMDLAELEAKAKATADAMKKVGESFSKDTDAISGYGKFLADATKGSESFNDAQEKLIDAQRDLRDLQARQAVDGKQSVSDQQALAKAHDKVAAAQKGVAESAQALKGADLASFYAENLTKAQAFANNIEELARRGLDPNVLMRLMQAGPEAAAPFIQGILQSNNANIIDIVNAGEKALATVTQKVLANARLTQQALNAPTDQKIKDIGLAMQFSAAMIDSAGTLTKQALSEKFGVPLAEVTRIMESFGILSGGLPAQIAPTVSATEEWSAKLKDLATALETNGSYVGTHTEGGKQNLLMIRDVIQGIKDHIEVMDDQGATMAEKRAYFDSHVADLRAVLNQAGLTKGEIEHLINAYGLIPANISTFVDADTSEAERKIARLKAELATLDANIATAGPGGGNRAAANQVEADIAAGGEERYSEEAPSESYQGAGSQQATGGILGRVVALAGGGRTRTKGFRTQGPTYLVGEGDPNWEEYVIASDPRYAQRNRKLWTMAGKRIGMLAEGGVISEDDPRWAWRTMGNNTRGVYIDGQGWMLQDANGNLSPHPYPPGTPKKEGMVRDGGAWVPAGTAAYPLAQGGNQTRIIQSYPSHQASSLVSRSYGGSTNSQDFRGMMEDIIRSVEGMGHNITIEVDGDVIARVAAKGIAKMAPR